MRCNNINSINKEAPITCKIRINHNNWNKKTLKEDHSLKILKEDGLLVILI